MAITTYGELKTAVGTWLGRSDSDISTRAAEFIALGEARIRGDRRMRLSLNQTQVTLTTTADSATVTLPSDFLQAVWLYIDGNPKEKLTQLSGEHLFTIWSGSTAGKPKNYTRQGQSLRLGPTPDSAYDLYVLYYNEFPTLSDSQTSNALLAEYPNIYLYAALAEAPEYLIDGNINWAAKYDEAVVRLSDADRYSLNSGSVLQSRTDIGNP